jgi:hypothetical protein
MRSRTTVNNLKISYTEGIDELRFEKEGVVLSLRMGEDNLNLLYTITPYFTYKKFLLKEQHFKCKECGKGLSGLKANQYALHHDPRLGRRGSRYIDFKGLTRNRVLCNDCHRRQQDSSGGSSLPQDVFELQSMMNTTAHAHSPSMSKPMGTVEDRLISLGYRNVKGKEWIKGNKIVHLEQLKESKRGTFGIYWREKWKDHHAIIFDYSLWGGPVCIVPIKDFFKSDFVTKKRREESYSNSGGWWRQVFPIDHELVQLILNFENRWDVV